jgi:hypothetical protein
MTKEQKQSYKENGYYNNGCYEIARTVFNLLYKKGERSRKVISEAALKEMQDYCLFQGWDAGTATYNVYNYGLKSLNYWLYKYASKLKP